MTNNMKCLVTGCAGFIGSTLSEVLLEKGQEVTGLDCFTDYYSRQVKESNISNIVNSDKFSFFENDVANVIDADADVVFHLAAQPGVRKSWGKEFDLYTRHNILATQRLLEACKDVKKFVFVSSSSVYGNTNIPFHEDQPLNPVSPYGISKLACEHLCKAYSDKIDISIVRLFTVYGPRQRPDMAFHKFIKAAIEGEKIVINGNNITRDFTYIDDIVDGIIRSASSSGNFEIYNLGGGKSSSVDKAVDIIRDLSGKNLNIERTEAARGDMESTLADITKARKNLGYNPKTELREGLKKEFEWMRSIINS